MASSGDHSTSEADALLGTVLADRYRVDELLGEGGMGKVYAAEHILMKKRVAIKTLRSEFGGLPDVVARFEREALATARIDHPNIAAATDFGRLSDGSLFFVLELVKGVALRDEITSGALPVERALQIARQIAGALAAAHGLDIVHRDLKPENVMLVTRGADRDIVKVLDFGIAKIRLALMEDGAQGPPSAPLTKAGEIFGTPDYMAPEQALGQNVDGRADLYALGVIIYEMLCGERPFSSKSDVGVLAQKLAIPVPALAERAPALRIPARVEQMVMKLLANDVTQRFQTAEELAAVLDDLLRPATDAVESPASVAPKTAFLGTAAQVYSGISAPDPVISHAEPAAPEAPVAAPQPSRIAHAAALTRQTVGIACNGIDENRVRLPARVQRVLRRIPAGVLLGLGVLVWGGMLFVTLSFVRARPHAQKAPVRSDQPVIEKPAADPVLAELAEAKQQGHAALLKLAERHPKSAPVLVELALSHAAKSDYGAAVATIGKALDADPKVNEQQPIADVLAAAVRKRDTADAAFTLLEGPMGALGAGILYDLAHDQKVTASLRSRAERWVRSPSFDKAASREVAVAGALRYAKSCSDRYDLLPQARDVGGKRALAYLKIMRNRSGCGRRNRDDCFSCLRKDETLGEAIAAIEKRLAEKPEKP